MKEGRLMKKWKQILALTLAVVVTLSVVPVGDARAAVEEPTEYAIVGEIINADGAEITVREVSKDGTENVELPLSFIHISDRKGEKAVRRGTGKETYHGHGYYQGRGRLCKKGCSTR